MRLVGKIGDIKGYYLIKYMTGIHYAIRCFSKIYRIPLIEDPLRRLEIVKRFPYFVKRHVIRSIAPHLWRDRPPEERKNAESPAFAGRGCPGRKTSVAVRQ